MDSINTNILQDFAPKYLLHTLPWLEVEFYIILMISDYILKEKKRRFI